jgi:anti-sigma factor RsiW
MDDHLSEEILNAYLDGELGAPAGEAVRAHLAQCESCRERMQGLEALFQRLETVRWPALQRDLAPKVLSGLPSRSARKAPAVREALIPAGQALGGLLLLALARARLQVDVPAPLSAAWRRWTLTAAGVAQGLRESISAAVQAALDPLVAVGAAVEELSVPGDALWVALLVATALWLVANPMLLRLHGRSAGK